MLVLSAAEIQAAEREPPASLHSAHSCLVLTGRVLSGFGGLENGAEPRQLWLHYCSLRSKGGSSKSQRGPVVEVQT